jgi:hypothetical protein
MASELELLGSEYEIIVVDAKPNCWTDEEIARCVQFCRDNGITAVVGFA